MVRQYFSKKESDLQKHISDLQKQHSGVKNSKENMKSVELPLSVAFNVTMPQSQSRLLLKYQCKQLTDILLDSIPVLLFTIH